MKKHYLIIAAAVLFLILPLPLFSQTGSSNPFYKGSENSSISKTMPVKNNSFIENVSIFQKKINSRISAVINDYKENRSLSLFLYIAGFAFIYGAVHSMTPGHGKNIILAWIMTSERTFIKVLLTAVTGMFFHVFNSVIMVYIIWYIIKGKISVQSPVFIKYFSYAACIILFIMSLKSLFDLFIGNHKNHIQTANDETASTGTADLRNSVDSENRNISTAEKADLCVNTADDKDLSDYPDRQGGFFRKDCSSNHSHSQNLEKIKSSTTFRECLLIALGIGMVPCPVAAILTVFMISGRLFSESIFTAGFFSAGMTLTLVIYTAVIWILRSFITGLKNSRLIKIRDVALPAAGSVLLMFSGFIIITPYISL